jgi:hypothetical protein
MAAAIVLVSVSGSVVTVEGSLESVRREIGLRTVDPTEWLRVFFRLLLATMDRCRRLCDC